MKRGEHQFKEAEVRGRLGYYMSYTIRTTMAYFLHSVFPFNSLFALLSGNWRRDGGSRTPRQGQCALRNSCAESTRTVS